MTLTKRLVAVLMAVVAVSLTGWQISRELVDLTDVTAKTGTGTTVVMSTSPALVTPALGTPASGVLTNTTGYLGDSSLVTVGTITSGTWSATDVAVAAGGTGASTATAGFDNLSPLTTLGDVVYHNGSNNLRLAGNTTAVKQFLSQTGNGSISAAPAWATITGADVSDLATSLTSGSNNQLLTDDGAGGIVSESGLVFDGTNVGIGTASPGALLHLNAAASPAILITDSDFGSTSSDGLIIQQIGDRSYFWNRENDFISFGTAGVEAVVIDASQNVGIGTASPSATLDVVGTTELNGQVDVVSGNLFVDATTAAVAQIGVSGDVSSSGGKFNIRATGSVPIAFWTGSTIGQETVTGTERLSILSTGNVGIGTASPGEALEVAGNILSTGTGAVTVSSGSTAQEPAASNGMLRYDTDLNLSRVVREGVWYSIPHSTLTSIADGELLTWSSNGFVNETLAEAGIATPADSTTGITASVTQTQGQQALTTTYNEVATVANANDVVTLAAASAGGLQFVANNGANTLQIFPASGDDIDNAGVNSSVTLGAGRAVLYRAVDSTEWWSVDDDSIKHVLGTENATQTTFTQAVANNAVHIHTDYTAPSYQPGLIWMTDDNNATKPKAGIYTLITSTGSRMYFGTSGSYMTGIDANVIIDEHGDILLGTVSPPNTNRGAVLALGDNAGDPTFSGGVSGLWRNGTDTKLGDVSPLSISDAGDVTVAGGLVTLGPNADPTPGAGESAVYSKDDPNANASLFAADEKDDIAPLVPFNEALTLGAAATTFVATAPLTTLTGDAGANTVATITGAQHYAGQRIVLLFVDGLVTITDTDAHTANTVDLSAAFTSADDTTLELISDGTSWYEISRSVN